MFKTVSIFVFIFALTSIAFAKSGDLAKEMKGKSLVCENAKSRNANDGYQGDEGFFKISLDKTGKPEISENGGSGYGFASGEVLDVRMLDTILLLDVGDDGHQTLLFDFFAIQDPDDQCASGSISDASDTGMGYTDTFMVKCCLK